MHNRYLGALLSGAILSLAFDPVGFAFAAPLGVAGLFVLAHRLASSSWRQVSIAGFAFGLGFMGPLIWWMNAVSAGAYVALVIAQSVYFALVLLGLRAAARLTWWPAAMPAVWTLGEFVRSTVPFSGFPWGRLAHTTIDTPLADYVRLVGMPATSMIVAGMAAALAWLAIRPRQRVLVVAAAVAATYGVGWLVPSGLAGGNRGESAEIAVVQGNIPGDFFTWKAGDIYKLHAAETRKLVHRIESGAEPRPDLVLWPENSTDVDPFHDSAQAAQIQLFARQLGAPILVGGIFDGPTVTTAYNAGVVWTADGPEARYVKRKVVPYGEYVPFRQLLGPIVPKFDRFIPRDMLPGDQPNVVPAGGIAVGDTICWDIAFDDLMREAVNGGAQVLVVQTSNASFTGTSQPEQQFKISRLRAIETGRWVLVPSTNGISAIVDASGRVVARAPMHKPATLAASVPLAAGPTSGILIGRWLEYAISLAGLVAVGLGVRQRTRGRTGGRRR
jgi:apolipoprotein N-acyltransferase